MGSSDAYGGLLNQPVLFVEEVEEQLVFNDVPAEVAAELIEQKAG
jgi:hypothetical protein